MRGGTAAAIFLSAAIIGSAALAEVIGRLTNREETHYRAYGFTDADRAELAATEFLRAVENGDRETIRAMIAQTAGKQAALKTTEALGRQDAQRHLIIIPREFTHNDTLTALNLLIKRRTVPRKEVTAALTLANNNHRWQVDPASDFFKALVVLTDSTEDNKERAR